VEALKAAGVVEDGATGVGQDEVLAGTIDQLFAELEFEALEGERDGGLGTQELFGGAGKALLRGNGQKDLKRIEFHGCRWDRPPGRSAR